MRSASCCNRARRQSSGEKRHFWPFWDKLRGNTWAVEDYCEHERITIEEVWEIAQSIVLNAFSSRGQAWPIGASQIQRKVCSLFGYFANFTPKSEPNTLYKSQDVDTEGTSLWERTRRGDVLLRVFFFVFLFRGLPRVQVLINSALRLISSHDSPPPPGAGNGGRRRTCLREMCWLKSIEVEDKKIIWRKVSHYFGIYPSTCVFILNSRFLCHTLKIFISLSFG